MSRFEMAYAEMPSTELSKTEMPIAQTSIDDSCYEMAYAEMPSTELSKTEMPIA